VFQVLSITKSTDYPEGRVHGRRKVQPKSTGGLVALPRGNEGKEGEEKRRLSYLWLMSLGKEPRLKVETNPFFLATTVYI